MMEHISQPIARILDELLEKDAPKSVEPVSGTGQHHPGNVAARDRFLELHDQRPLAESERERQAIDLEIREIVMGHSLVEGSR